MCDLETPRFLCLHHQVYASDDESIPLDIWLENNIPDGYRLVTVLRDKIITDVVAFSYQIILEKYHAYGNAPP